MASNDPKFGSSTIPYTGRMFRCWKIVTSRRCLCYIECLRPDCLDDFNGNVFRPVSVFVRGLDALPNKGYAF